jgi:hypothetical protein
MGAHADVGACDGGGSRVKGLILCEVRRLGFLYLFTILVGVVLVADVVDDLRHYGAQGALLVALFSLIAGWLASALQVGRERSEGTVSYLVHREGLARAWAVKGVVGLAAAFVAVLLPLVLGWRLVDPGPTAGEATRVYVVAATTAGLGYGAGALASTWLGRRWTHVLVGLLALMTILWYLQSCARSDRLPRAVALGVYSMVCVGAGIGGWWLAGRRLVHLEDEERAPTTGAALSLSVITLALVVPPLRLLADGCIADAREFILDCGVTYERPWRNGSATTSMAGGHATAVEGASGCAALVSEPVLEARLHAMQSLDRWSREARDEFDEAAHSIEGAFGRQVVVEGSEGLTPFHWPDVDVWFDRGTGRLRCSDGTAIGPRLPRSSAVLTMPNRLNSAGPGARLVVDPESGRVWCVELDELERPRVREVALPPGQTLQGFEPVLNGFLWTRQEIDLAGVLIATEDGVWTWNGERFLAAKLGDRFSLFASKADVDGPARPVLADPDLLRPRVVVRDPATGETLVDHAHASEWRHAFAATVSYTLALARGPLAAVRSAATDVDPHVARASPFEEPLVAGGRRPWLLAVHLLLAAVLVRHTLRRLGRGARGWAWSAALVAFGPFALVAQRLVEPPVRPRVTYLAPPEILIQSKGPRLVRARAGDAGPERGSANA